MVSKLQPSHRPHHADATAAPSKTEAKSEKPGPGKSDASPRKEAAPPKNDSFTKAPSDPGAGAKKAAGGKKADKSSFLKSSDKAKGKSAEAPGKKVAEAAPGKTGDADGKKGAESAKPGKTASDTAVATKAAAAAASAIQDVAKKTGMSVEGTLDKMGDLAKNPSALPADKKGAATEAAKAAVTAIANVAEKAGLSVKGAIDKINDLFSSRAGTKKAEEASNILKSFKDADLGNVLSGLGGKTMRSLLRESSPDGRKGLIDHVADKGNDAARGALSGGIQREIDRIGKRGTEWIKFPQTQPGNSNHNHGGPHGSNNNGSDKEIRIRQGEIHRLSKSVSTLGGDKGSGPIG